MVFFNHATRQMTAKIVYYGPGLCGKTTNLNTIYGKTSQKARGEMVSLNTETDRTLFFDLLPMDVGMVGGFKTKLQLYTVPGQVFYNSTRKLVLKGVDGIVFVVDSQTPMLDACKESYQNLQENLRELGLKIDEIPLVYQWNKRDLKNVVAVDELERSFNPRGLPSYQAVASDGSGVFETLRGVTKLALGHIKTHVLGEGDNVAAPAAPAPAPAAPPPAAAAATSAPTPAKALTLSDLPSVSDILDQTKPATPPKEERTDSLFIEAPHFPDAPPAPEAPKVPTEKLPPLPDEDSGEEAALPKPEVPKASAAPLPVPPPPPVSAPTPAVARPSVPAFAMPKPPAAKPAAGPKLGGTAPLSGLLGELTMVSKVGTPAVLRLDLPEDLEGDIEVVVQVKVRGAVVAEKNLTRNSPPKGVAGKLSVELKRG